MTLPQAHNAIGYISETLRSVCCDAPLLMITDFMLDRENIFCGHCCMLVGAPTGDDYFDLYRDRIPRWHKGERITAAMRSLTEGMKAACQALNQAFGRLMPPDHLIAFTDVTARVTGANMEMMRYFAQPWGYNMSEEDVKGHPRD